MNSRNVLYYVYLFRKSLFLPFSSSVATLALLAPPPPTSSLTPPAATASPPARLKDTCWLERLNASAATRAAVPAVEWHPASAITAAMAFSSRGATAGTSARTALTQTQLLLAVPPVTQPALTASGAITHRVLPAGRDYTSTTSPAPQCVLKACLPTNGICASKGGSGFTRPPTSSSLPSSSIDLYSHSFHSASLNQT